MTGRRDPPLRPRAAAATAALLLVPSAAQPAAARESACVVKMVYQIGDHGVLAEEADPDPDNVGLRFRIERQTGAIRTEAGTLHEGREGDVLTDTAVLFQSKVNEGRRVELVTVGIGETTRVFSRVWARRAITGTCESSGGMAAMRPCASLHRGAGLAAGPARH